MDNNFTTPNGKDVSLEKATSVGTSHLGTYNDKDEYVIAPAIIEELLNVEKYKKTTFKNSVFCTSFLPVYGELTFEIVYEKNTTNNTALASIYLLENEYKVNGYLQNTIKTKIGEFVGDLDGFIEKSYAEFKVSVLPVGESKNYKVTNDQSLEGYIVAKQQFNNLLDKISKEECNKIYENYFTKRLEVLHGLDSSFAKAVLAKFKDEYAKIEKYFLKDKDYRALSELLDKCIEDISGTKPEYQQQEEEYRTKILPLIILFVDQMEKTTEKASGKAKNMMRRKDQEKINDIEKQEQTAKPPQSNTGKDKPTLTAIVKGDAPKVVGVRGVSSDRGGSNKSTKANNDKNIDVLKGILNKLEEKTPQDLKEEPKNPPKTPSNTQGDKIVEEFKKGPGRKDPELVKVDSISKSNNEMVDKINLPGDPTINASLPNDSFNEISLM